MPLFDHDDLFRNSGPQEMLEYLQSRLDACDLSSEEALALLSAVHEELGHGKSAERSAYEAYSRFMESLRARMPEIHDYVVSSWGQRGGNILPVRGDPDGLVEQVEAPGAGGSKVLETGTEKGFDETKADQVGVTEEGMGEAGAEVEEQDDGKVGEAGEEESEEEEEEKEGEETEEKAEEEDERSQEQESAEKEQEKEEIEGDEQGVMEEGEEESRKDEAGDGSGMSEAEEVEAEQEAGEPENQSEAGESESGAGGHAEMEWPQIEEPGPEEPIEGEEGETPPAD
jgi:hypothetical protein